VTEAELRGLPIRTESGVGWLQVASIEDVREAEGPLDAVERAAAAPDSALPASARHLAVRIGSVKIGVDVPPEMEEPLKKLYRDFLWDGETAYTIVVKVAKPMELERFKTTNAYNVPGSGVYYLFRWDFIARVDLNTRRAVILVPMIELHMCVDSIIRVTTSFSALLTGGVLLHSSAVAAPQGGVVFCGVSGSGKSTTAALSRELPGHTTLTDEMALLEPGPDGYTVYGTPFIGEAGISTNIAAPLRAVMVLTKAKANAIRKLSPAVASMELLKVTLCFGQDADACRIAMDAVLGLIAKVPVARLEFLPDVSVWRTIDEYLG